MKFKSLMALIASTVMFCAASQAATLPPTLALADSFEFRGSASELVTSSPSPIAGTFYYELFNNSTYDLVATFTVEETVPAGGTVNYNIYNDAYANGSAEFEVGGLGSFITGGPRQDGSSSPFFLFTLAAGAQYILELSGTAGLSSVSTSINAVPLPGAIWLFGSALLGFLGFSARRKV